LKRIIIIGAGYVGLTLGIASAKAGYEVFFIDINDCIVNSINNRCPTFYEKGLKEGLESYFDQKNNIAYLSLSDFYLENKNKDSIYIVSLGTPLSSDKTALLEPIENVTKEIVKWMNEDDLLILRSTVAVGTSRYLLNTIDGLKNISFCPERTIEGKALEELNYLPQIISGSSIQSQTIATDYFKKITPDILTAETLETAELVKLASNTFRDLNFAYSNLLALIANKFDVNVNELINLSNFRYERNKISFPGLVGGPCLEKDTYILAQCFPDSEADFIVEARKLNEYMALKAIKFIQEVNKSINYTVLICGAAFKGRPVTSDTRGSFVFQIIDELLNIGVNPTNIHVIDPVVTKIQPDIKVFNHYNMLKSNYNFMIQLTNHEMFDDKEFNIYIDKSIDHIISFWPRAKPLNKKNKSLFIGGVF